MFNSIYIAFARCVSADATLEDAFGVRLLLAKMDQLRTRADEFSGSPKLCRRTVDMAPLEAISAKQDEIHLATKYITALVGTDATLVDRDLIDRRLNYIRAEYSAPFS